MPWETGKNRAGPAAPSGPEHREDEEILAAVRAVQDGAGPDAFTPIFRRFYRPLHDFFVRQRTLREEADDLAQLTFVRAWENLDQYRFEASLQTWLRRIGENVWLNAVRERRALKRGAGLTAVSLAGSESEGSPALEVPDREPTPEQKALDGERTRILRAAIEALPPGMRKCAELRLFTDLKYREIAAVMGVGLNTVRSQLFEARRRLKPVLDEHFQGWDPFE